MSAASLPRLLTDLPVAVQIPNKLWENIPETTDRAGNIVPEQWYFVCPTPCGEYTCEQCLQIVGKHCAMYAEAGVEASSFIIQAINTFGYRQISIDDNFTVTIAVRMARRFNLC